MQLLTCCSTVFVSVPTETSTPPPVTHSATTTRQTTPSETPHVATNFHNKLKLPSIFVFHPLICPLSSVDLFSFQHQPAPARPLLPQMLPWRPGHLRLSRSPPLTPLIPPPAPCPGSAPGVSAAMGVSASPTGPLRATSLSLVGWKLQVLVYDVALVGCVAMNHQS